MDNDGHVFLKMIKTRGKRWELFTSVDVLSVNLELPRLLHVNHMELLCSTWSTKPDPFLICAHSAWFQALIFPGAAQHDHRAGWWLADSSIRVRIVCPDKLYKPSLSIRLGGFVP